MMFKLRIRFLTITVLNSLFLLHSSCSQLNTESKPNELPESTTPIGKFMGLESTVEPVLLFPDFINTPMGEYNGTFNPSGSEFFYTTSNIDYDVLVSTVLLEDGSWSKPEIASFSANYAEFDPLFSPDGEHLYFSSHRPVTGGGSTDVSEIWRIEKNEGVWKDPIHLPIFGPKQGNYFSSITNNGDIYFNIWNTGDIYQAVKSDTGFVVNNLPNINSSHGDGDPFVAHDGSYLIFRSYRPGGIGSGDLWISYQIDDEWLQPLNLEEPINSKYNEMCPYVTTDGKLFIFSSGRFSESYYEAGLKKLSDVSEKLNTWDNGQQNIYSMSADFIHEKRLEAFEKLNNK